MFDRALVWAEFAPLKRWDCLWSLCSHPNLTPIRKRVPINSVLYLADSEGRAQFGNDFNLALAVSYREREAGLDLNTNKWALALHG